MLSLSVMRLVPPPGRIAAGRIVFDGREPAGPVDAAQMRDIRGNRIAMIFQEPMTSLNPVFTVGDQITEAMRAHDRTASAAALRSRAIAALQRVRIPAPERRFDEYPHQMSGGMRQRVMIAMALACEPDLLIADEPTTALDVTVQAQILDLLRELQQQTGMAIILITHDLGVVAEMADEVAVMYAGRVVERAPGRGDLRRAAASLHAGPARQHPEDRGEPRPAAGDRGHRAARRSTCRKAAASIRAACSPTPRCTHAGPAHCALLARGPSRRLHPRAECEARASCMTRRCWKSRGLTKHFHVRRGLMFGKTRRRGARGGRHLLQRSTAARRWRWWANPAAASPPPRGSCCG